MPTNKKRYRVEYKPRVERTFPDLPVAEQKKLKLLIQHLEERGPLRAEWRNYSCLNKKEKTRKKRYHCHLGYSWAACWTCEKKSKVIEVTYAGSRENAPY